MCEDIYKIVSPFYHIVFQTTAASYTKTDSSIVGMNLLVSFETFSHKTLTVFHGFVNRIRVAFRVGGNHTYATSLPFSRQLGTRPFPGQIRMVTSGTRVTTNRT